MPESLCKLAEANPDGLGRRHQDGARSPRLRLCHLLPPGLFIFRFTSGCSGRDPAQATFSKQIRPAVGLGTAPEPVCLVKLLQAFASGSSASSFSPSVAVSGGNTTLGLRALPVRQLIMGTGLGRDQSCVPSRGEPMHQSRQHLAVGATGSCRAGACSATRGVPLFGKKEDEFWNMFISCSLHLVVVSINMPLTHAR